MIVKEDLVTWFKNLESYKRIDIMCTLLNLCLPFELRFLGTCLEELGRRDAQDLRGAELRVNNPQDFVNDLGSFQNGHPTETKIRRKMALYLALLRVSNRSGVNELFKTLDRWGDRDFTKFNDGDSLQELLLVYTMATNHPVFSFEQRLKCGEIYRKITSSKAHLNQDSPAATSPITSPLTSSTFSIQQTSPPPPPFTTATFQPPPPAAPPQLINPLTQQQQIPNPILMAFPPTTMIPTADPSTSLALNLENLPAHMAVPPAAIMQIPTDFSSPPPWQQMRFQPQVQYTPTLVQIDTQFPPQATSPHHLSQPSSPTHSRTGSPTRQMRNNRTLRNQQPPPETTPTTSNDIMVKNFEDINMEGAISQLHSLTLRNGYNRPVAVAATLPRQHHKAWPPNYSSHMTKQQQSDSGSSTGEASPPPDTTTGNANQTQSSGSLRNKQQINLSRLNGGKQGGEFNNGVSLVTSSSTGNLLAHNFPPAYRQQQQRQFPPSQPNGEQPIFFVPLQPPVVVSARAAAPTGKMMQSCFNCGSTTHTGLNCNEASMEDVTRNAVYKLDYTINTPPQIQFAMPMGGESLDPSITFIDLTQDSTSSSSSSSTSSIHGRKD